MKKRHSLDELLEEYKDYLINKAKKGAAKSYITDIRILLQGQPETYENCGKLVEIIGSRVSLINKWDNSKQSTKNKRISVANSFLKFLEKTNKIGKAPHYRPERIERIERSLPKTLTKSEFMRIIDIIPFDNYKSARDRAVFSLMFYAGITPFEAVNLEYKNFVWENGKIVCMEVGKGYKRRKLEVNDETAEKILTYSNLYLGSKKTSLLRTEKMPYFRNKHGGKISTRSLRRNFQTYIGEAGLSVELLSLRHSYAQAQIAEGKTRKELAELMGVTTSRAYILKGLFVENTK